MHPILLPWLWQVLMEQESETIIIVYSIITIKYVEEKNDDYYAGSKKWLPWLRYISVSVSSILPTLQILFLHQCLDASLDHRNTGNEPWPHLRDGLCEKMSEGEMGSGRIKFIILPLVSSDCVAMSSWPSSLEQWQLGCAVSDLPSHCTQSAQFPAQIISIIIATSNGRAKCLFECHNYHTCWESFWNMAVILNLVLLLA